MAKFKQEYSGKNGWSRWIAPLHGHGNRNYRLGCCDCDLVHDMQFRTVKEPTGRISVIFRVRRNNRSTAALRRNKKK